MIRSIRRPRVSMRGYARNLKKNCIQYEKETECRPIYDLGMWHDLF